MLNIYYSTSYDLLYKPKIEFNINIYDDFNYLIKIYPI